MILNVRKTKLLNLGFCDDWNLYEEVAEFKYLGIILSKKLLAAGKSKLLEKVRS